MFERRKPKSIWTRFPWRSIRIFLSSNTNSIHSHHSDLSLVRRNIQLNKQQEKYEVSSKFLICFWMIRKHIIKVILVIIPSIIVLHQYYHIPVVLWISSIHEETRNHRDIPEFHYYLWWELHCMYEDWKEYDSL